MGPIMKKTDAIQYFGGSQKLADEVGLKSRQAIYAWPEEVPDLYQYLLHYRTSKRLPLSPHLQRRVRPT